MEMNPPRHEYTVDGNASLTQWAADTLIAAHFRLYRQVEAVNGRWLECLVEMRESQNALRRLLMDCRSPSEATVLCQDWSRQRATILASNMQRYGESWLEFCATLNHATARDLEGRSSSPDESR